MIRNKELNIFIDESGNTGDVIVDSTSIKQFHGQPYFILTSIGIESNDIESASNQILKLKQKYSIKATELKSRNIIAKKHQFINNLLEYFYVNKNPIFIELVDKKFFLTTNIIDTAIFPPHAIPNSEIEKLFIVKREIADYLYYTLSENVYIFFCETCRDPNFTNFNRFLYALRYNLQRKNDDYSKGILLNLESTIEDYVTLLPKESKDSAHEIFLPYPDKNKKGELIYLLPHTPSFTNICARGESYINRNDIDKILFIHDEQYYFEHIMNFHFKKLQSLKEDFNLPDYVKNRTNFNISNLSVLNFQNSQKEIIIQVSDLFARFINKIWSDFKNNFKIKSEYKKFIKTLDDYQELDLSLGINYNVAKPEYYEFHDIIYS